MSLFTWLWIWWLVMFAVIEGVALFRRHPGATFSEHVWAWFEIRTKPAQWTLRRAALAVFLLWLLIHMVAGF